MAGVASSLAPGFGQLITGARAAGWLLLVASASTAALIGWGVVNAETESILSVVTDPDLILVTVAINLIVGLIRLLAATDAWWRAGGRIMRFGLAALVVFTMVPHAAVAYVGFEARSNILRVFPEPLPQAPIPVVTTTSSTTTTVASKPPLVKPWSVPTSSTTTTTTTTIPLGTERLTILLLGGDAGHGRSGLRTDTVMVATVDTLSGAAAIFGLPRNMACFRLPDGPEINSVTPVPVGISSDAPHAAIRALTRSWASVSSRA